MPTEDLAAAFRRLRPAGIFLERTFEGQYSVIKGHLKRDFSSRFIHSTKPLHIYDRFGDLERIPVNLIFTNRRPSWRRASSGSRWVFWGLA